MLYDLAVIGAGPAGSSTAIAASRMGLDVIVLERDRHGRDKYCGGGITVLSKKYLKELGADDAETAFEVECEGHVLVLPSGRVLIDAVKGLYYAMVRRCVFDARLAEAAESMGARVLFEAEAASLKSGKGEVTVRDKRGNSYRARYVVIATGMRDSLASLLGFPPLDPDTFGHCWGTEAPYDTASQVAKWRREYGFTPIFLFFGIVTYGYFWVFPKAKHMNVGMGTTLRESKSYGKLHLEGYAKGLRVAKELGVLDDTSPFKVDRGWILPSRPRERTYSIEARALLVGDAAGFVHPATGEGISSALRSGMLAAQTVKEALDADDPSMLAKYEEKWWRDFGEELFVYGARLARLLYGSPFLLEWGLRAIMEDRRATKLLSALLYRSDPRAGKKLYEYVIKRLPFLMIKAVTAKRRRRYADL